MYQRVETHDPKGIASGPNAYCAPSRSSRNHPSSKCRIQPTLWWFVCLLYTITLLIVLVDSALERTSARRPSTVTFGLVSSILTIALLVSLLKTVHRVHVFSASIRQLVLTTEFVITAGAWYGLTTLLPCTYDAPPPTCTSEQTTIDLFLESIYEMTFVGLGIGFASTPPIHTPARIVSWCAVVLGVLLRVYAVQDVFRGWPSDVSSRTHTPSNNV